MGTNTPTPPKSETETLIEQNSAVLDRWLAYDYTALAPDALIEWPDVGMHIVGEAESKEASALIFEKWFEAELVELRRVVGTTGAVVEWEFSGRHVGEFLGVPATGREVREPFLMIYEIDDGTIKSGRLYMSAHGLLEQINGSPST